MRGALLHLQPAHLPQVLQKLHRRAQGGLLGRTGPSLQAGEVSCHVQAHRSACPIQQAHLHDGLAESLAHGFQSHVIAGALHALLQSHPACQQLLVLQLCLLQQLLLGSRRLSSLRHGAVCPGCDLHRHDSQIS